MGCSAEEAFGDFRHMERVGVGRLQLHSTRVCGISCGTPCASTTVSLSMLAVQPEVSALKVGITAAARRE